MSKTLVHANESTAAQRRVYFDLRDATDGITAETGEGSGQPQISTNGGSWTNTGIGTLTHIGSGRYYADLTQAAVATAGDIIETRYKSANTAESPGDSVQVVGFDPASALSTFDASADAVDLNADQSGVTIGGITGTINTLDALDTAQDTQHASTQSDIAALNDLSAAQVNAEVDTALTDYDPPTKTEMDTAFTEIKGAGWSSGTDTLEEIGGKASLITSSTTLTVETVSDGDVLEVYQGGSLTVSLVDTGNDWTGYSAKMGYTKIGSESGDASGEVTGTLDVAGGNTTLRFALSNADTATMALNNTAGINPLSSTSGRAYRYTIGVTYAESGTAQAGATSQVTLAAGASAVDDFYNDMLITTADGDERIITDYNGTTKVATVNADWDNQPTGATTYDIDHCPVRAQGEMSVLNHDYTCD